MLNTIDAKVHLALELSSCLQSARQEPTYLPLEGIAQLLHDSFDEAERERLAELLV
ncbi:MAG: hypothetical protein LC775_03510 [Acidobacteria bacterium]|nr:hypothetical protein [Acidobacteriota bacterium]